MSHLNSQSSPQNLHNPADNSFQQVVQPPKHPKIKPLVYQHPIEINEQNFKRKLKLSSKTSKTIKSVPSHFKASSTKFIKGFFKSLKAQRSFSQLSYLFSNLPNFENAYLFSKLRGFSSLTSLQLDMKCIYKFNISFQVLLKSLASLKNLIHLHIIFLDSPFRDKKIPKRFIMLLQYLKKVKHFSLELKSCEELKEDFQNIVLHLKRFTHLQSLQLKFNKSMVYNDKNTIKNLASVIPKLENLTKIDLEFFGRITIKGPDIVELFRSFQNLKGLSDLALNLHSSIVTNETNAEEPLSQGLTCLDAPLIKRLKLVPYANLDDQSFGQIFHALKRFTSLNSLDLSLSDSSLASSQWILELHPVLKDLKSLSSLSLSVPSLPQDGPKIEYLIRPLHNLTDLKLNFAGKYEPEHWPILHFAGGLKALKKLKILHIHFPLQDSVTDETFETIVETLKELVVLRDLSIKFGSVDVLTTKKVENLTETLKKLQTLSHLCLNFGVSNKIDDKALVKISQALENLPHLSSLELGLQQTSSIKDKQEIYEMLFGVLNEKKNINQVILHLTYSEFNAKEIKDLEKVKYVETQWRYIWEPKSSSSFGKTFK